MEVSHFHAQLGLISRGIGISVIPTLVSLKRTDLDLVTIPISAPEVNRQLGIVTYRDRSLPPAGIKLRNIARSVMQRWGQEGWKMLSGRA